MESGHPHIKPARLSGAAKECFTQLNFRRSWEAILSPEHRVPVGFPRVSVPVGCRVSQAECRAAGEYLAVAFLVQRPSFDPLSGKRPASAIVPFVGRHPHGVFPPNAQGTRDRREDMRSGPIRVRAGDRGLDEFVKPGVFGKKPRPRSGCISTPPMVKKSGAIPQHGSLARRVDH
jgi:hypothetical protein